MAPKIELQEDKHKHFVEVEEVVLVEYPKQQLQDTVFIQPLYSPSAAVQFSFDQIPHVIKALQAIVKVKSPNP